jgi:hypothetical protein
MCTQDEENDKAAKWPKSIQQQQQQITHKMN